MKGFMQISAETREVTVHLYNEGKSQTDLLKKRQGHLAKVYKECFSGEKVQESQNVSLKPEESISPQKDLIGHWSGFL